MDLGAAKVLGSYLSESLRTKVWERVMADTGTRRTATITEEALSALRSRIGREFLVRTPPNLEEAGKDAIRHWAQGIGDRDPKWVDEEYAAKTRFGVITAPPSMLYGFDSRALGDRSGLPGIHSYFGGADHEWYKPINRNDTISLKVVFTDLVEKQGRFAGRMFQQISECTFTNQLGEVVARSWPWGMRVERRGGSRTGTYGDLQLATYTDSEIAAVSDQYSHEHEQIRGAETRYWEDVAPGDRLGPIIRGPWSATVSINFLHAHGGMFWLSHGDWYDYLRRHPRAGIVNELGVPEGPQVGHWDNAFARKLGLPGAYDHGPERIAWLTSLSTYWAGDDGWLQRLKVELKRFNFVGDLTTVEGIVTGKSDEQHTAVIHANVWARDQRGVDTATATARIVLPRRAEVNHAE